VRNPHWTVKQAFSFIFFVAFVSFSATVGIADSVYLGLRMPAVFEQIPTPISPTPSETAMAGNSSRQLASFLSDRAGDEVRIAIEENPDEVVSIPISAFRLLADILTEMSKGNAVTFIPIHAELTTQQAADFLNVSRPFVVKLIDEKKLPCRKVGTHRRVLFQDLVEFKRKTNQERAKTLDELAKQAQDLDMGY
jgi:excisionase family DNA binding protein